MDNDRLDELAILERIEMRLKRLESDQWSRAFQNLDFGQLALDLRRERDAAFPERYFSDNAWDILLELYGAYRRGEKMQLTLVGYDANISKTTALRYLDILMQDGFVYREDDPSDNRRSYAILTESGAGHLDKLFQRFQDKVVKRAGVKNAYRDEDAEQISKFSQAS